ncbi:hypothetical protein PI124_g20411 [Phytophthora idaei]|nr:hypothetical protein PI124_g20411 [Phytophthora idaei]
MRFPRAAALPNVNGIEESSSEDEDDVAIGSENSDTDSDVSDEDLGIVAHEDSETEVNDNEVDRLNLVDVAASSEDMSKNELRVHTNKGWGVHIENTSSNIQLPTARREEHPAVPTDVAEALTIKIMFVGNGPDSWAPSLSCAFSACAGTGRHVSHGSRRG